MKGLTTAPAVDPGTVDRYEAPYCRATGAARGARLGLGDFPLWALRGRLDAGAGLVWDGDHGDEALYLLQGDLLVDGRTCPEGGAVIVESRARGEVVAPSGADIVHFGPRDPDALGGGILGPPAPDGHGVHVVGPGGVYSACEPGRDTRLYADSTCERCRLFLLLTGRDHEYISSRHSHSADEIIFVLRGQIRFGSYTLGPGEAGAIRADLRYAFRSGPDGFAFLNYRAQPSDQTIAGEQARFEGGQARGLTLVADIR
jgi:hypothetical protein